MFKNLVKIAKVVNFQALNKMWLGITTDKYFRAVSLCYAIIFILSNILLIRLQLCHSISEVSMFLDEYYTIAYNSIAILAVIYLATVFSITILNYLAKKNYSKLKITKKEVRRFYGLMIRGILFISLGILVLCLINLSVTLYRYEINDNKLSRIQTESKTRK